MMSNMNEKIYHIDNVPASAVDIIEKAKTYSIKYNSDWICQTSVAAMAYGEQKFSKWYWRK